ncbi:MAG: glucosamine-6-phosphate deaminase [Gordonia sp. (in: high G+C Gram-positive bacteria)]
MTPVISIVADEEEAGSVIARRIADDIEADPQCAIGVATGSSPLPIYRYLAVLVDRGLSIGGVDWFALDEYLGLADGHPESYRSILLRDLARPLSIAPAKLHLPDPFTDDPDAAAGDYEHEVSDARVRAQIVGIGRNGHLGFNEPGTPLDSPTHRARLTESTRAANARFFDSIDDVPQWCITQGLGTIMRAARIELIATGEVKADAVARALYGPVSPDCPASVLQTHPQVYVTLDAGAASALPQQKIAAS